MQGRRRLLATLLAMVLLTTGALGGGVVGNWILPLCGTVWGGQGDVQIVEGIFANPPQSLRQQHHGLYSALMLGSLALTIAGLVVGGGLGQRLWRYIIVKKLRWMTDNEVNEFWKRDPGF